DEDEYVGVRVGFPDWMIVAWATQVVEKRVEAGLDEVEEEVSVGEEDVAPRGNESGDGEVVAE
ncbi:hypothetical protein KI387_032748, partial [Taxus chinensis]